MEKELEYLKMYLDWSNSSEWVNSELTINNQSVNDYILLKENDKPIIETYDIVSIRENNIVVSHMEDRISNKIDTIKVGFETFSLEDFKKSNYFNSVINSFSISYEKALEKGKELYNKYQKSISWFQEKKGKVFYIVAPLNCMLESRCSEIRYCRLDAIFSHQMTNLHEAILEEYSKETEYQEECFRFKILGEERFLLYITSFVFETKEEALNKKEELDNIYVDKLRDYFNYLNQKRKERQTQKMTGKSMDFIIKISNCGQDRWQKQFKLSCTEEWYMKYRGEFCEEYINNMLTGIEQFGTFDASGDDQTDEWNSYEIENRYAWLKCVDIFREGLKSYRFIK